MRLPLLTITLFSLLTGAASAHENQCYECGGDALAANRAAEIASIEHRLYRRFEHPSRMRRLRAEIGFAEQRIVALRRVQMEYDRVNRFGTGNALTLSAEQVRLDLMREELLIRDLREQLLLEQRYYRFAKQHHAYQAQQAVNQRAALVAGEPSITIINH